MPYLPERVLHTEPPDGEGHRLLHHNNRPDGSNPSSDFPYFHGNLLFLPLNHEVFHPYRFRRSQVLSKLGNLKKSYINLRFRFPVMQNNCAYLHNRPESPLRLRASICLIIALPDCHAKAPRPNRHINRQNRHFGAVIVISRVISHRCISVYPVHGTVFVIFLQFHCPWQDRILRW